MIPYNGLDLQSVIINEIGQLLSSLAIRVSSSLEPLFMPFAQFPPLGYLPFSYWFVGILICIIDTNSWVLCLQIFFPNVYPVFYFLDMSFDKNSYFKIIL